MARRWPRAVGPARTHCGVVGEIAGVHADQHAVGPFRQLRDLPDSRLSIGPRRFVRGDEDGGRTELAARPAWSGGRAYSLFPPPASRVPRPSGRASRACSAWPPCQPQPRRRFVVQHEVTDHAADSSPSLVVDQPETPLQGVGRPERCRPGGLGLAEAVQQVVIGVRAAGWPRGRCPAGTRASAAGPRLVHTLEHAAGRRSPGS